MKTVTIEDLKKYEPTYDSVIKYLPKNWKGTVLDILNLERCSMRGRIWIATRGGRLFFTDKQLKIFACDCVDRILRLIDKPLDNNCLRAFKDLRAYADSGENVDEDCVAAYFASVCSTAIWSVADPYFTAISAGYYVFHKAAPDAAYYVASDVASTVYFMNCHYCDYYATSDAYDAPIVDVIVSTTRDSVRFYLTDQAVEAENDERQWQIERLKQIAREVV